MALKFYSTVLNVQDVKKARDFWMAALGFKVRYENWDWASLEDPEKDWHHLSLQLTDNPKTELNRLHFDLKADDGPAEVERLKSLGATVKPWDYGPNPNPDYIVMNDPEGNEFCIVAGNLEPCRIRL